MHIVQSFKSLSKFELRLWVTSVFIVCSSSLCGGFENILTTTASIIGVTALIFVAKGDVFGIVFSLFYAVISFQDYGEMITYLCMPAPIAALAVVSWLHHPFEKGEQEVEVNRL